MPARATAKPSAPIAAIPLYHASLDPAEYATLLDGIGFDIVAHVVEDPQAGGRTVWLARSRA